MPLHNDFLNYIKALNKSSISSLGTLLSLLNFHKLNLIVLSIKFSLVNHVNFYPEIQTVMF